MAQSLNFVLLVVALLAAQVFSAAVPDDDYAQMMAAEIRAAATVYHTVTTTASGPTTVTKSTRLVCATLLNPVATTACRRKRQYWSAPIYIQLGQQEDVFQPSEVLKVEPSSLPEFRRPSPVFRPIAPQYASPFALQPSFGENSGQVAPFGFRAGIQERFFRPYGLSIFSSLFSNIISSILTPAVTSTTTKTVYTTTVTSTSYTSTAVYTLQAAPCLPPGVNQCPASSTTTTSTTAASTTTGTTSGTTPTTGTTAATPTSTAPTTTAAPTAGRKKREADDSSPWDKDHPFQSYIKSLSI